MRLKIIVFLDFDGVLHLEPCAGAELFCHLPLVEEMLPTMEILDRQITLLGRRLIER